MKIDEPEGSDQMTKTSKPHPTTKTKSKTAAFLDRAIEFSGKAQSEIAREAGFAKPNVLSMMKQGQTKVPIDRIPALAEACHVDPVHFLKLALQEYQPEIYDVLRETVGEPLTRNETELVIAYRLVCQDEEIEMEPQVTRAIIETLLEFREEER